MAAIIGSRTCAGCKHFAAKGPPLDSECHRYPPVTTVAVIGVHPQKGPMVHREVGYAIVHKDLDACGEYVPRLATELD